MQGAAASHHDSAPMQPPGTSFGNRFRQMTRSFTRRRPSCVRTYWNRTEPESYRISSESRSHPGRRLFTRLLRGFGARSRIFAVQRSLSAAGPGRPAEFPNRVSQSLRHISPPLQRHTDESVLIAACRHSACVQHRPEYRIHRRPAGGRPAEPDPPVPRTQALQPPQTPSSHGTQRHWECVRAAGTSMRRPARRKARRRGQAGRRG